MPLFSAKLVAVCWLVLSSLWSYPYSLSYFNESVGGPLKGPKHLLGNNVDWGQDLRYLKWLLTSHPNEYDFYLVYFGSFIPTDIGMEFRA